jgi:hypothetical protein
VCEYTDRRIQECIFTNYDTVLPYVWLSICKAN